MKTLIATAAILAATPLLAQTPLPYPAPHGALQGERFKAADSNRDNALSRAEWDAAHRANDPFARMDANKDGKLTEAEIQSFRKTMRAERGGRPGGKAGRDPAKAFARADSNADGSISSAEWQAAGRKPEGHARMDSNRDGTVTRAEFDAAVAQLQARRSAG